MTATQFWLFLLSTLTAGLAGGAYLFKVLSERRLYRNHVRWQRELRELQTEHDQEIARLTGTLDQTVRKQTALVDALRESEETVGVLSAERVPAYENDIAERNSRIVALEQSLAHQRARTADAEDHEKTLVRRHELLQEELHRKESRIDELTAPAAQSGLMRHGRQQEIGQSNAPAPAGAGETQPNAEPRDLQIEMAALLTQIEELRERLSGYDSEKPDYRDKLKQRDAQVELLSHRFDEMRRRLPALNDALREREASIEELIEEINRERRKAVALDRLADVQTRSAAGGAVGRPTAKVVNIQQHRETVWMTPGINETKQTVRAREREPDAASRRREAGGMQEPRDQDDLKQINGIGPVLEARLNGLGIFRLEQIAGLNSQDIRRLSHQDPTLPGRIRRFRWIEQAANLRIES